MKEVLINEYGNDTAFHKIPEKNKIDLLYYTKVEATATKQHSIPLTSQINI